MISHTLETFFQLGAPVIIGILIGLIFKASFTQKMQSKIRDYRNQILKCQSDRLMLEHQNDLLQKRLNDLEGRFINDKLFLN